MTRLRNMLAACAVAIGLAGCMGMEARTELLMPVMATAWGGVAMPLIAEEAAKQNADQEAVIMESARAVQKILDDGDLSKLTDLTEAFRVLKPIAEAAIDARVEAGKLGPQSAALMRETLRQFELNLNKLRGPAPATST